MVAVGAVGRSIFTWTAGRWKLKWLPLMLWESPSSHGFVNGQRLMLMASHENDVDLNHNDNDNDDDNNDGDNSNNDSNSSESLETATRSRTKETLSLISFFFRHSFNS